MNILSLLIFLSVYFTTNTKTDSPHGADFKVSCSTCHSSKSWKLDYEIYSYNHNVSNFPLKGQHSAVSCRQCHVSLVFKEAKNECNQCHNDIHQGTVGSDCSRCHTPASWLVNNVNEIHQMSRFPLLGMHRTADCSECHKSENLTRFDVPGINCIDCHRQDFLATTSPNHVESGMSEDCKACHLLTSFSWDGAGFDHSAFPLVQGHSLPKCIDCHTTGNYTQAKPECNTCHQQDYLAAKEPDHVTSAFSINCNECHTLSPGWKPTTIDHTSFPLTLGHATPKCSDCHLSGNYTTTPIDCNACHQQDFQTTKEPDHVASQFSINCTECHTTNPGWKPTTFNHNKFPLTQGHAIPKCSDCHISGNYTNTPIDCYSCHQQNFITTTDPNHQTSGFSITCTDCHTTNPGWKPATFNHTSFPLTLGHAGPSCNDCHNGNYSNTSNDCYSCHQSDYNNSLNPNHKTLGFSVTCTQCHTTNPDWKPAKFLQHDTQFPIYSGKHQGEWSSCVDCHKNTSSYAQFTCIDCHEHNKNDMDNEHIGEVSGYSWVSSECFRCHPRGNSD